MSYLWYWPKGGWDFERWKQRQRWRRARGPLSGTMRILPLVKRGMTIEDWREQARQIRGISDEILGHLTDRPPRRMKWENLGDELVWRKNPKCSMQRIRYRLTKDEWGYAWLVRPVTSRVKDRRPAILALHPTNPHGKDETVGLRLTPGANPGAAYGTDLASRGFVVLVPDAIGFGERLAEHANAKYRSADTFFEAHPEGSVIAKMAYDTSRGVDLLQQLDGVDPDRIGCIGHSHGAYGTLFAMLADDRIKVGVMSCGLNLLRRDPTPLRWWRWTCLIPRLGFYEGEIERTPIDFHHWLALLAPRPIAVIAATRDVHFRNTSHLRRSLEPVREVYRLYDQPDAMRVDVFDGPHEFREPQRARAFKLLAGALRHEMMRQGIS